MRELYEELGLDEGCGFEEVKRAYRYLSKKYHPDRTGKGPARFLRVAEAYKTLESEGVPRVGQALVDSLKDIYALGEDLLASSDPVRRRAAARGLGFSGRKASWLFLRKALYDSEEDVVLAAVRSVAFLSLAQAQGEIASLYSRSPKSLRLGILKTAEKTQEGLFESTLESAKADRDPEIACMAWRVSRTLRGGRP